MNNQKIKFIVNAVLWFDRVNGNTYHSAQITRTKDGKTIHAAYTYGYGEHYKQTALEKMIEAGFIDNKKYNNKTSFTYERENNYPIFWDARHGTKKECIANGQE